VPEVARNLDELAAELRRPAAGLSAFKELTGDQIALLAGLIDDAVERRRRTVDEALARAIPPRLLRAAAVAFLRRRSR
jgi:hypothetical protein